MHWQYTNKHVRRRGIQTVFPKKDNENNIICLEYAADSTLQLYLLNSTWVPRLNLEVGSANQEWRGSFSRNNIDNMTWPKYNLSHDERRFPTPDDQ